MDELLRLIQPNDRVLVLGIPDRDLVLALAEREAAIIFLGGRDAVYDARRDIRDNRNLMFHPGDSLDIPFDDGFLTKIIALEMLPGSGREIARVLAGGGFVYAAPGESESLFDAGLVAEAVVGEFQAIRKPEG
jgi:hypothetical protein